MEKNEIIWKNAEQSFVSACDFAKEVVGGKWELSLLEQKRLLKLLILWKSALEDMVEHASDAEMAQDFQNYLEQIKTVTKEFEDKFGNIENN